MGTLAWAGVVLAVVLTFGSWAMLAQRALGKERAENKHLKQQLEDVYGALEIQSGSDPDLDKLRSVFSKDSADA